MRSIFKRILHASFRLMIVYFGLTTTQLNAAYGDLNPGTCAPSGLLNIMKEKVDPKSFWAHMVADTEQSILYFSGKVNDGGSYGNPINQCEMTTRTGSPEQIKCMLEVKNTLNYYIRCNQHAKQMCRLHGGYC